jgi:hypothetical protein
VITDAPALGFGMRFCIAAGLTQALHVLVAVRAAFREWDAMIPNRGARPTSELQTEDAPRLGGKERGPGLLEGVAPYAGRRRLVAQPPGWP